MPFSIKTLMRYASGVLGAGIFGVAIAFLLTNGAGLSARWVATRTLSLVYQSTGESPLAAASSLRALPPRIARPALGVPRDGRALLADLDEMTMAMYEDGVRVGAVPIIAKGKPGSAWETPGGQYQILGREENHFSSIGEVYMPYSLQFFGNYFVHGWPYYPNGTPVSASYSGGCLRLATDDAKRVYDFATVGTPLIIARPTTGAESEGYYSFKSTAEPVVTAKSFLVADLETGEVILERERDTELPIASITKLFTALVSLEAVNQFREVTVDAESVATFGDSGGLVVGETMSVGDLLYPLLLESSNDAGEVLARQLGRSNFISYLNKKAAALGFTHTTLVDPSGIGDRNISTASDIFRLYQYLYRSKSFILKTLLKESATIGAHEWRNNSEFLARPGYLGGKSGHTTAAADTIVAGFDLALGEVKRPIVIVLLGSENRALDTVNLLKYLEENLIYEDATRLIFVGDLMLDRAVRRSVERAGGDYDMLFRDVARIKSADLAFGNLEGPLSDQGEDRRNLYSFRMAPEAMPAIAEAGFDILSFANNHVGDWGRAAFDDSLARLSEAGIAAAGAGANKLAAETPAILERDGTKFGFIAFTDVGPDWLAAGGETSGILLASDPDHRGIIERAAAQVDFLIVSYHFGEEYLREPSARQRRLAREAIDAGAKVVVGHHPHVTQPLEEYHGGLIKYSLGNFIFDQNFSDETMEGDALELLVRAGELVGFREHAVTIAPDFHPVIEH